MTYELTGEYPAATFFAVDQASGQVTIKTDLRTDNIGRLKYTVRVFSVTIYFSNCQLTL